LKKLKKAKIFVKSLLPPILLLAIRKIVGNKGIVFDGNYKSWQDAQSALKFGYDSPAILDNVKQAARKVKNGEAVFERDSVCFMSEDYRWPILSCLLMVAAENEGSLRIVDFGGSLGSFYNQHKKFLNKLKYVRWLVVEQRDFVKCGQEEFETEVLKFKYKLDDCFENKNIDVVLFSSVLQYLESPYEVLKKVMGFKPKYVLIDRTAFLDEKEDRLTLQHVPSTIYSADYPAWFLSKDKIKCEILESGYKVIADFMCEENFGIGEFRWMMLEKC
jgi:putative methyltransferase (TIGR04325 family)